MTQGADILIQPVTGIETIEQFKEWIRGDVRQVLPHEAFVCGHGRMHAAGIATDYVITVDFPVAHLEALCNPAGGLDTPLMRRWMQYREPQLLDAAAPSSWPELSPAWLQQFTQHDLRNAAVHAVFDTERYLGSYFSFHRLPHTPGAKECDILRSLVPVLHDVLVHVVRRVEHLEGKSRPAWDRLTQRELEMLEWIGRGMGNGGIARHMQLSENTVKHHVGSIFEKTGLPNRFALMAALARHPPGMVSKGTRVF